MDRRKLKLSVIIFISFLSAAFCQKIGPMPIDDQLAGPMEDDRVPLPRLVPPPQQDGVPPPLPDTGRYPQPAPSPGGGVPFPSGNPTTSQQPQLSESRDLPPITSTGSRKEEVSKLKPSMEKKDMIVPPMKKIPKIKASDTFVPPLPEPIGSPVNRGALYRKQQERPNRQNNRKSHQPKNRGSVGQGGKPDFFQNQGDPTRYEPDTEVASRNRGLFTEGAVHHLGSGFKYEINHYGTIPFRFMMPDQSVGLSREHDAMNHYAHADFDHFFGGLVAMKKTKGPRRNTPSKVLDVKVMCDTVGDYGHLMTAKLAFDVPFHGVLYVKGYYHAVISCSNLGNIITFPLDGCGTTMVERGNKRIYSNKLVVMNDFETMTLGEHDQVIDISCTLDMSAPNSMYPTAPTINVDVLPGKDLNANHVETLKAGQTFTLLLSMNRQPDLDMSIHMCRAYDGADFIHIPLVINGCAVGKKVTKSPTRWQHGNSIGQFIQMKAFKFPDVPHVYIHCVVDVCTGKCPSCEDAEHKHGEPAENTATPTFQQVNVYKNILVSMPGEEVSSPGSAPYHQVAREPAPQAKQEEPASTPICLSHSSFHVAIAIVTFLLVAFVAISVVLFVKYRRAVSPKSDNEDIIMYSQQQPAYGTDSTTEPGNI